MGTYNIKGKLTNSTVVERHNKDPFHNSRCLTVGQDCQKCKETSSHLANKQQKRGEHVEF